MSLKQKSCSQLSTVNLQIFLSIASLEHSMTRFAGTGLSEIFNHFLPSHSPQSVKLLVDVIIGLYHLQPLTGLDTFAVHALLENSLADLSEETPQLKHALHSVVLSTLPIHNDPLLGKP